MYEKALVEMKNSLKNTDLIIVVDKNGKIMYYNNFNDIYNESGNQDNIGKSIFDLYPWLTKKNSTIFKVIDTGEPLVNQFQTLKISDGNSISAINSAFPLINDNEIIGAIEISSNILSGKNKNKKSYSNFNAKYTFDNIITKNAEMIELINKMKSVSRTNSSVLIYGETGTGKEIVAHSIHNQSNRWNKPFITQNCAAIPSTIIEGILFGSVKGSFTGADDKPGLFETANGGTIYLDEINSMPMDMQAKLLRVLESRAVRRVGDNKDIEIDIRVIASTNEKPYKLLESNEFRSDLFYRLNVVGIEIPPLKDRLDDIEVLCKYYIEYFNNIFNKNVKGITSELKSILTQYNWPGNIRELRNCLESAFNVVNDEYIEPSHIPSYISGKLLHNNKFIGIPGKKLPVLLDEFEKETIEKALAQKKYNIVKTANELGIPRQTLYYKLRKYNLL